MKILKYLFSLKFASIVNLTVEIISSLLFVVVYLLPATVGTVPTMIFLGVMTLACQLTDMQIDRLKDKGVK